MKQHDLCLGKNISTCPQIPELPEFSPRQMASEFLWNLFPPSGMQGFYQCILFTRSDQQNIVNVKHQHDGKGKASKVLRKIMTWLES